MPDLLVHLEEPNNWQRYMARHVLERMLGWEVAFASGIEEARSSSLPVFSYGMEPPPNAFSMAPILDVEGGGGGWVIGREPPQNVFAMASFILQEGIAPDTSGVSHDEHGRVPTRARFLAGRGLLDRPLVDEWVISLGMRMTKELHGLPPIRRRYMHIATLDVDNGFKYLGRPLWRTIGSAARDLLHGRIGELWDRASTLIRSRRDPYDVYEDFHRITEGSADRIITNFLVARHGKFDHAVGLSSRRMIRRMQGIAQWSDVGLHPSYSSSDDPRLFSIEKTALEQAIDKKVVISRQHFLRFRHPDTFLELERIGIKEDHSVGLHDNIGFRAGTCTPFPFFDVKNDRETDLMIFPFQVMDSALAYKMKLTPDEAIAASKRVIDKVRAVQGTFIGVWHERFISDHGAEKGWRRVVKETIRYAKP